jgi:hypothetical protein
MVNLATQGENWHEQSVSCSQVIDVSQLVGDKNARNICMDGTENRRMRDGWVVA